MNRIFNALVTLCLVSLAFVNSQHDHKVNVAVYYESMCEDSIKFVTKQLYPAFKKPELSKHMNITLVPYGKTTTSKDNKDDLVFDCHHGAGECRGNKIHACALHYINSTADGHEQVITFINCLLDKVVRNGDKTEFPTPECAVVANIQVVSTITNCAVSIEGSRFLNNQGLMTDAIQKPLKSVPTVVFDGKFNATESTEAQNDFIKTLCTHISHDKPAECQEKSGAEIQSKPIGITLMLLIVAFRAF